VARVCLTNREIFDASAQRTTISLQNGAYNCFFASDCWPNIFSRIQPPSITAVFGFPPSALDVDLYFYSETRACSHCVLCVCKTHGGWGRSKGGVSCQK